jgi:hypothetical protein
LKHISVSLLLCSYKFGGIVPKPIINDIDRQAEDVRVQMVDAYLASLTNVFAVHHSREFATFLDADAQLALCFDAEMSARDRFEPKIFLFFHK